MATCRGIDVSVYQNAQDWAAHKQAGVTFAFAKASEGQRTHDAHFATHITGIKQAGLIPGAYHFAWPNQDAALEAANYIAAVRPYAGRGFVHWLDLERRSDGANYKGCTAAGILAWVTKWLKLVSEAFPGQRVGVYTSGSDLAAGHVPAGTTIWYPAYTWGYTAVGYEKAEAAARPKPSGWTPLLWQFTSTPIDRSIAYLSAADLRAWAGLAQAKPTRPSVSLAHVVTAARKDPAAPQGHTTHRAEVLLVERALAAEKLLASQWADGSFGSKTVAAYAAWQKRLGYRGSAADGIPGHTSLAKLGDKHGFTVTK